MPSSPIANDQINPSPGSSPALVGYAQLASKLSLDADLSIFRRFGELNVRNILYLQSELLELEQKLHRLDNEADKSRQDPTTWFKPRSYYYASRRQQKRSVGGGDGDSNEDGVNEYWDTVLKIREVLGQYNEALRDESWLQSLKSPSRSSSSTVQKFLAANKTTISEVDAQYIMAPESVDDLVRLSWHDKEALGVLLERHLKTFFKKKNNRYDDHTIGFVSDEKIAQIVRLLAISLSSVLPIVSIVVLYVIHHAAVRLGVIIIFSVLCSLALATLTNARNVEILGTTAAYAAVQVVFVSGNLTNS